MTSAGSVARRTHRSRTAARPRALLQRKCACGGELVAGGECAACRAKRIGLAETPGPVVPEGGNASFARYVARAALQRQTGPGAAPPAPRPLPGAALRPPGDCEPLRHRALQDEVDRACDRRTGCTQNDSCPVLWDKITFNAECIKARASINAACFRGGNQGHIDALTNAVTALGYCWEVYNRRCVPRARPAPAPAGARAPATAPGSTTAPATAAPAPAAAQPVQAPARPVVDRGFMERMAAITGLTGSALVMYIIVSEGSRLFPPRNLVPIP